MNFKNRIGLVTLLTILSTFYVKGEDWTTWRYDAGRTASSTEELTDILFHQWTRHYSAREQVWDDPLNNDLMQFDKVFEPIVAGNTLFIGFNDQDKVVALDTKTGKEIWSYYADGPVRLPLTYYENNIYFTSDDGYLYSISATNGELLWRFRGGPADRKMLGNKRMISTWPARGGVVVEDGIAYFAASIWPSMGTFIYALDARSGEVVWRNDGTSSDYVKQPHSAYSFAGIAPQGTLAINGDHLFIPGGRSVAGCFDKNTGEQNYYHINKHNKSGGAFVSARGDWFVNHHRDRNTFIYEAKEGNRVSKLMEKYPVLSVDLFYFSGTSIVARNPKNPNEIVWEIDVDASGDLIQAGTRLYAGGKNKLTAIQLKNNTASIAWEKEIDGNIGRLIAANGNIFAVTLDGKIMAFGAEKPKRIIEHVSKIKSFKISKSSQIRADAILQDTKVKEGYALYFGENDPGTLASIAQKTELSIIAVVSTQSKVDELRIKFDKMGFKASKVAFLPGTPETIDFAPYFSSLTIIENINNYAPPSSRLLLDKMYSLTRPFGGKIWISGDASSLEKISSYVKSNAFDGLKTLVSQADKMLLSREGAPKGSANWTHLYGDVSNTIKSDDELVKLPLGVLWFGGISNMDVLPRHGHGPPEQIMNGKLIIQGVNSISARDVYTGRPLWKTNFETLSTYGMYYNESYSDDPLNTAYNQEHLPGVNTRGTNYVITEDYVYVAQGYSCHMLDMEDGEIVKTVRIPNHTRDQWGYIGISGDNMIAGAEFVKYGAVIQKSLQSAEDIQAYAEVIEADNKRTGGFKEYGFSASQSIVVANRHNFDMKWAAKSQYGFIHNAITSNESTLFAIDKVPVAMQNVLSRRGIEVDGEFTLTAFNIESGDTIWQKDADIFGSWLSYSKDHDILLQATRPSRDMIKGEPGERMMAIRASDGKVLWDKKIDYYNPPIIHGKKIIVDEAFYDIKTGEAIKRVDPITGEEIHWAYTRTYGCNYIIGSENLLSFRSGAAGYYDLSNQGGTGNLGGFKSGCTSNLIAANGVLNAPDYTRTCSCSYQNQTSLSFVYMPKLEYWTNNEIQWSGKPVKQIGINFGAPGDRMADNNTLWLDYPSVGGNSPDIPIEVNFVTNDTSSIKQYKTLSSNSAEKKIGYIRTNSFNIETENHTYVAASAINGVQDITITLSEEVMDNSIYTVKLYFAEIEKINEISRVFDVEVQGEKVLSDFNISKETNGINKLKVKTIEGVLIQDKLNIKLSADNSEILPLLSGIELIRTNIKLGAHR